MTMMCVSSYFSTLKAGRDAAACVCASELPVAIFISVPSKRVETLPHCSLSSSLKNSLNFSTLKACRDAAATHVSNTPNLYGQFQYPQSGSRRCRNQSQHSDA